jgi:hypothetical protein
MEQDFILIDISDELRLVEAIVALAVELSTEAEQAES